MATAIPNRAVFRSQEVCDIVEVQPYVLRSWEAEFPDLGMSKSEGGPRVYRRADVERVLRLKHLLFVEGLTLAGARRQLSSEGPIESAPVDDDVVVDADVAAMLDKQVLRHLHDVRQGLHWILGVLNGHASGEGEFRLSVAPVRSSSRKKGRGAKAAKPVRSKPARAAKPARAPRTPRKAVGKRKR